MTESLAGEHVEASWLRFLQVLLFFKLRRCSGNRTVKRVGTGLPDSTTMARCIVSERLATQSALAAGQAHMRRTPSAAETKGAVLRTQTGTVLVGVTRPIAVPGAESKEGQARDAEPLR